MEGHYIDSAISIGKYLSAKHISQHATVRRRIMHEYVLVRGKRQPIINERACGNDELQNTENRITKTRLKPHHIIALSAFMLALCIYTPRTVLGGEITVVAQANPAIILGAGESADFPVYIHTNAPIWQSIGLGIHVTGDLIAELDISRMPFDDTEANPEKWDGWLFDPNTGLFSLTPVPAATRWYATGDPNDYRSAGKERLVAVSLSSGIPALPLDVGLGAQVSVDPNDPNLFQITHYGDW